MTRGNLWAFARTPCVRAGLLVTLAAALLCGNAPWAEEDDGIEIVARLPDGAAKPKPSAKPARAQAVIQIWMWGGPPHLDTFDPKPEAGYNYCGPLKTPLQTNVPGIQISELLPLLAQQADKYSIIRSVTHGINGHETAAYIMQTGHKQGEGLVHPSAGAVVSLFKGFDHGYKSQVAPYVILTTSQGRFSEVGFLGSRYKPFVTGGDPNAARFAVEGLAAAGITEQRQKDRASLLRVLDSFGRAAQGDPFIQQMNRAETKANELMNGEAASVFDLNTEPDEVREKYGRNKFGQSCLMARRLVEHGVKYVTINYPGWDTHKQHFEAMRRKLPELDKGMAALLQDLAERRLLDRTIVWWGGEFGRTPKVQWEEPWNGGRSHFGKVFSVVVAGGGFHGGRVVGKSDARGEDVAERPVTPQDLLGSIFELLGIDPEGPLPNPKGLDVKVMPETASGAGKGRLREIMKEAQP